MTGRAKWDAWNSAGQKYPNGAEVEQRYLEIARDLGWSPGVAVQNSDITDEENEIQGDGIGGMGNTVSVMSIDPDELDHTVHGLAIADNVTELKEMLNKPDIDVNTKDEFVSSPVFRH